ncbi:hypothetical protein L288_07055 [Sphingobium quisquiliarum P25]|uniref:High-potential iron-sulfur protein n=1 Tax=Sphingobium quisquiliarum P25 TaxID=1329909 RepID=T0IB14_9SPHN|nr:high-potential iron-sulfur protein [Sphingobium quisquiliarum]EQB08865.1 hypothetical protein L288_07055 [Sphingobium quisquiliarum P25]
MASAVHLSTRRQFLRWSALLPAISVAGPLAAQEVCADPRKNLQQSLRRSLGYQEISNDPKRVCGGCAFFTADGASSCGKCQLLSGGVVTSRSVCTSWAGKS